MNNLLDKYHPSIQQLKNNWIHQYFKFRINGNKESYKIRFRNNPYKILFILSHMRSGSSLLTHILISNPEIIGFGESHLNYESESNFKGLMMRVYWENREFSKIPDHLPQFQMNHQYVLDKVLHNHKFLKDDFLGSKQVYSIFLLREPYRTIPSLLDLKPHWNQNNAYEYYVERLLTLQKYAGKIADEKRTFFLTYNQLLENTNSCLLALQKFLNVKEKLSEEYQILSTTGKENIGDYKGNIKAGKIVRNQRKINIEIDKEILEKANKYYQESVHNLSQYCQKIF